MRTNALRILYATRQTIFTAAVVSSFIAAPASVGVAQTTTTTLRIGVVTSRSPATRAEKSVLNGIRLGRTEAGQTAKLFGSAVEMFEANGDARAVGARQAADFLSSARKVQVLIGVAPGDADALARFAEQHGLIFLDVSSRSDALRLSCLRNSFHVAASETMYAAAQRLRAPQTAGGLIVSSSSDSVVLWDSRLERFGASQLNDRYRAAAGSAMDGDAWAGWAAIKFVAEAALRSRSTDPSRLRAYMESPTTQFDGHKGWQLSFRPLDHQLRQPLYMVVAARGGARVVDIPDLRSISSASSDRAAADALDLLAGGAPRCAAAPRG